jgi:hypothetical protein
MERLRVELRRERLDLLGVEPMRVADESLPHVKVVEIEAP